QRLFYRLRAELMEALLYLLRRRKHVLVSLRTAGRQQVGGSVYDCGSHFINCVQSLSPSASDAFWAVKLLLQFRIRFFIVSNQPPLKCRKGRSISQLTF